MYSEDFSAERLFRDKIQLYLYYLMVQDEQVNIYVLLATVRTRADSEKKQGFKETTGHKTDQAHISGHYVLCKHEKHLDVWNSSNGNNFFYQ